MKARLLVLLLLLGTLAGTRAFVLRSTFSGSVDHWDLSGANAQVATNIFNPSTHAIRFFLGAEGWSTTNTAAELNALRACFGQWQSVPGTAIKFEDAGTMTGIQDLNSHDGTNTVFWSKSNMVNNGTADLTSLLGLTFFNVLSDGTIAEADIVLNANPLDGFGNTVGWFTDFNDTANTNYFIEGTASHEMGHLLGLNHSPVGGATMLYISDTGVSAQVGLSADEVAFARFLYPAANPVSSGAIAGTITLNGNPVLGAMIVAEDATGNVAGGTVSLSDGSYVLPLLAPGGYQVRVCPLDPANAANYLVRPANIAPNFAGAATSFLPAVNPSVTVTAGTTNSVNWTLTGVAPAFRISWIRRPTLVNNIVDIVNNAVTVQPGQNNLIVGVLDPNLPTNSATFTVTGDGLTFGALKFATNLNFGGGLFLNMISVPISIASNATPGLRSFVVQQGANVAYANGFIEVLPPIPDYNFDGLDDRFQRKYFPLFTAPQAAPTADPDGDGFNNLSEYIAGTDPTDPNSLLHIQSTTQNASGATITWQSVAGKSYQVSSRPQAGSGTWQNIGSVVTANSALTQFLDPAGTGAMKFYRVQVLP